MKRWFTHEYVVNVEQKVRDEALQRLTKLLEEGQWVEVKKVAQVEAEDEEALQKELITYKRKLLRMLWEGLFFGKSIKRAS